MHFLQCSTTSGGADISVSPGSYLTWINICHSLNATRKPPRRSPLKLATSAEDGERLQCTMELLRLKYLPAPGNTGPEAGLGIDSGILLEHELNENVLFKFVKHQIQNTQCSIQIKCSQACSKIYRILPLHGLDLF